MSAILIFADVQDGQLQAPSFELATLATQLNCGTDVHGALLGSQLETVQQAFNPVGVSSLFVVDHQDLACYDGDNYVAAAAALIERVSPELVLFVHSADISEWVPRLAAKLSASLITGCSSVEKNGTDYVAVKSNCGGAFVSRYRLDRPIKLVTIAAGSAAAAADGTVIPVEPLSFTPVPRRVELVEVIQEDTGSGPALKSARIVVAGGIGVGGSDNWHVIDSAASELGGAVGASRAAVDMGWVPSTRQVGFSGLKVSADVYIAAGISGAIHHLAGLGRVKTVVAINDDAEANIYSVARYGVVGDLKQVLPAFVARVKELKGR